MRIIGGQAAGALIEAPEGLGVRPTPDKVKLAIFNSLGGFVLGARVLDLFAGSGALGLECLSRGASQVVSIEKSEKHARYYRNNLTETGLDSRLAQLRVQDVFTAFPQFAAAGEKFDLIIADPPYGEKNVNRRSTSFAQKLLDDPSLPQLLNPNGLFVLGHTKRDTLELVAPWRERKRLQHGDTIMLILVLNEDPPTSA